MRQNKNRLDGNKTVILENDICAVILYVDETYTANFTDDSYHDIELNLDAFSQMDFY